MKNGSKMKKMVGLAMVAACQIGLVAHGATYLARVVVPGENGTLVTNNYETGTKAFQSLNDRANGLEQKLIFLNDITPSERLTLKEGKVAVVEVGSRQLQFKKFDGYNYSFRNDGRLTINGSSAGNGLVLANAKVSGFFENYGTLVINDVVKMKDSSTTKRASILNAASASLTINGGIFDASAGNSIVSNASTLAVYGGTFTCSASALPALNLAGGEAEIAPAEGKSVSITSSGHHAIAVSDGTLTISGGSFSSTASGKAALYGNAAEAQPMTISGGTFTAAEAPVVLDGANTLTISGGTFVRTSAGETAFLPEGKAGQATVKGGTFKNLDPTASVAGGYLAVKRVENGVNVYIVKNENDMAAQVGNDKYLMVQAALDAAAKSGEVVTLLADVTDEGALSITNNVTLNLNDKSISGCEVTMSGEKAVIQNGTLKDGSSLIVTGNAAVESMTVASDVTVEVNASVSFKESDLTAAKITVNPGAVVTNLGGNKMMNSEGQESDAISVVNTRGETWTVKSGESYEAPIQVIVSANDDSAGTVGLAEGYETGLYHKGETAKLTATPNDGYTFVCWSGDVDLAESAVEVQVNGEMTIKANFVATELYDVISRQAVNKALENNEIVSRDTIKDMSLQNPMIEVVNGKATVGIKIMTATTLQRTTAEGTSAWTEVAATDEASFDSADKTVKVKIPADGGTRFFRFVVPKTELAD